MTEPKVVTVTLNPALLQTLVIPFLAVGYQNRVTEPVRLDPAGRGINISRALHNLGVPTKAVVLLGTDTTGQAYTSLLAQETVDVIVINTNGSTHSEIVIADPGNGTETHLIEESAEVSGEDVIAVGQLLQQMLNPNDIVVFAGALPNGVARDSYAYLTDFAQDVGAQVVVSTDPEALEQTLRSKPELIALNEMEAEGMFNYPIRTYEDLVGGARQLHKRADTQVLVVVKDKGNAVMVEQDNEWFVEFVSDEQGTLSGIWDAMLAGFLAQRLKGRSVAGALELGAAAASYTASHLGTEFGSLHAVEIYCRDVKVSMLNPDKSAGQI